MLRAALRKGQKGLSCFWETRSWLKFCVGLAGSSAGRPRGLRSCVDCLPMFCAAPGKQRFRGTCLEPIEEAPNDLAVGRWYMAMELRLQDTLYAGRESVLQPAEERARLLWMRMGDVDIYLAHAAMKLATIAAEVPSQWQSYFALAREACAHMRAVIKDCRSDLQAGDIALLMGDSVPPASIWLGLDIARGSILWWRLTNLKVDVQQQDCLLASILNAAPSGPKCVVAAACEFNARAMAIVNTCVEDLRAPQDSGSA